MVPDRRHVDDPRGRSGTQAVEQQRRQVEVPEVVDAERLLEALRGQLAR
jgi:hypothetical protein